MATSGPAGDLAAGYEALRAAVLGGSPSGWRLGLGLVTGRGVAAWMAAWSAICPIAGAGTTASVLFPDALATPQSQRDTPPSSLPQADRIVSVIAQMALAHT